MVEILRRERTIIGSVSYRNRYWVYLIDRPILRASLQVHQLLTDRITHNDQRALELPVTRLQRARTRAVLWSMDHDTGVLEGREAEGDSVMERLVSGYKDGAVLVLATITPHSLHQQEVITTVNC